MDKLTILGFLIAATVMESGGEAIVRVGLAQQAQGLRTLYFLAGAALLFGYGLTLNLAPISFGRTSQFEPLRDIHRQPPMTAFRLDAQVSRARQKERPPRGSPS
jgi:hypothetical protein